MISRAMGQGDRKKASQAAGNAVCMGILICIIFLLFGFFGVPLYVSSQNTGGIISQTVLSMTQVLFILPIAWFIGKYVTGAENVQAIWWTFLIGEAITLICAICMYVCTTKKKINNLIKKGLPLVYRQPYDG